MELVNDFAVNVPIDEAWVTLTDVERIAPCLPGAQLQEVEGDVYRGIVKVKVGPILAQFKGQATFIEKDDVNHKAVLKAEGRDTGGKGNASALITAQLDPDGNDRTKVTVTTDLTITGKVAQFGRGALADVSTKLLNQFVVQLEQTVLTGDHVDGATPVEAAPPAPDPTVATSVSANDVSTVRQIDHEGSEPVDLMDVAGGAVLKRLAPIGIVGLLILIVILLRRRKA